MKSLAVLVIFAVLYSAAADSCPPENCLSAEKCEEAVRSADTVCQNKGDICCSVVRSEFRTHCRHHGGVCMERCSPTLQRETVDCAGGTACCVLV